MYKSDLKEAKNFLTILALFFECRGGGGKKKNQLEFSLKLASLVPKINSCWKSGF